MANASDVGGWVILGAALGASATFLITAPLGLNQAPLAPPSLPSPALSRQTNAAPGTPDPPLAPRGDERRADKTEPPRPRPDPKPADSPAAKLSVPGSLPLPPSIPNFEYPDMPNGYVFHTELGEGNGQLKIVNGTGLHAVAKLVDPAQKKSVHTVLIRSDDQATVEKIPDGGYRLLFALGRGWSQERQRFYEANRSAEFQRRLIFTTTMREGGDTVYEYYSEVEVTLHPVVGGNAKTTPISEDEFAKY